MLDNCKYKAESPFVCQSAYRGVIGSINFMLINSASNMLRQEQTLNPGGGGIDAYNELLAAQGEHTEEERSLEEMGLETRDDPRIVGGQLRLVSAALNEELLEHAPRVFFPLSRKTGPDPWTVGDSIEMTLARQIARTPRDLTAAMKAEAKALNVSEEVIHEALKRQQATSAAWLANNRELILEVIHSMNFENPDALTVETVWDKLPAMTRFRLYAAADGGLFRKSQNEAQRYIVWGRIESKSNVGLCDGERRVLRTEINGFLRDEHNKREIQAALDNGATMPVLQALPPVTVDAAAKKLAA
jgi:hypothetical protein